jgi:hypothetical protein
MSDQSRKDPKQNAPPAKAGEERKSGRVRFDERGQAVWEWAVQTGMFDRNASTQRIRALTEAPVNLQLDETVTTAKPAAANPVTGNPYERVAVAKPGQPGPAGAPPRIRSLTEAPVELRLEDTVTTAKPAAAKPATGNPYERVVATKPGGNKEPAGSDPYSRGPARRPENVSFNPHERKPDRKP